MHWENLVGKTWIPYNIDHFLSLLYVKCIFERQTIDISVRVLVQVCNIALLVIYSSKSNTLLIHFIKF